VNCLSILLWVPPPTLPFPPSGVFTHTLGTAVATATQSFYAHRYYSNLMVMEVMLERQAATEEPVTVRLSSSFTPRSKDIVFRSAADYRGGR